MTSTGDSAGDSDYVESTENSPTSPANTPDLAGHISKLEKMHNIAESEIFKIAQPTVIFSCIDKLELPELDDADIEPPKTSKTMAPCRRYSPSHIRRTQP